MKAEEIDSKSLMIGNYIDYMGHYEIVDTISDAGGFINNELREAFKPIPITPEILEKAGFDYVEELAGWADANHCIFEMKDEWRFDPYCTNDEHLQLMIKYVHQLQNLVFILSGSPLNLTL